MSSQIHENLFCHPDKVPSSQVLLHKLITDLLYIFYKLAITFVLKLQLCYVG